MPISKPEVTFNIISAEQLLAVADQRALIVGQMIAGTATAGDLTQDVSDATNDINELFGEKSIVAEMVREFKRYNKLTSLDVIALSDNGTAIPATSDIAFSGTATSAGSIYVSFGSDKRYRARVDISIGDTSTVVAAAVLAAFAEFTSSPFVVTSSAGTVTATASNGGTHANDWTVRVDGSVGGITPTVTSWAGGATDPSLTGLFDVTGSVRYQTVVMPSVYDVTVLESFLDARFNATNDILDGVGVQVKKGTLASLKSYVSTLNSQSLSVTGDKVVDETLRKGTSYREIPDVTACQLSALRALRLTDGANLSQYQTTVAALDQFGGASIASLPYFNTSLPNMPIPLGADEFTQEDQNELRDNGISLIGANRAFNTVIMGEMVTTYLTDNAGNPDSSFKFLNTVDTASVVRETFSVNYKNKYAQTRLTNGDLRAGRDVANRESIIAFSLEIYKSLADSALVQSGQAAEKDFLDNLVVTIDLATGTVTINAAPLLVTQVRAILGTIQVNFGV